MSHSNTAFRNAIVAALGGFVGVSAQAFSETGGDSNVASPILQTSKDVDVYHGACPKLARGEQARRLPRLRRALPG